MVTLTVRALVTGAAGFLGRHVTHHLADAGIDTTAIIRRPGTTEPPATRVRQFDLLDEDADPPTSASTTALARLLEEVQPTHVFHIAGALRRFGQPHSELINANITATEILMQHLARLPHAPAVILPGSAAVYGQPDYLPINEQHPLAPTDIYGVSKAAQEMVVEQHHRVTGCPIALLRIFNIVGPGQPAALVASSVARQIVAAERGGEPTIAVGNLSAKRDMLDVRDVARAVVAAATLDRPRTVVNICSGLSFSMAHCVELLCQAAQVPVELVTDAARMRANDVADHRGDPEKMHTLLAIKPEYDLQRSMLDLLEAWRQQPTSNT